MRRESERIDAYLKRTPCHRGGEWHNWLGTGHCTDCDAVRKPDLTAEAMRIFEAVLASMQEAEELHGPIEGDYVMLMNSIAAEANLRARCAADLISLRNRENLAGKNSPAPKCHGIAPKIHIQKRSND
jgi:hypothetical protein